MLERISSMGTISHTAGFTVIPVHRKRVRGLAKGVAAVGLTSLLFTAPLTATAKDTTSDQARDAAVISEWNQIAQTTLTADTTTSVPEDFLYMGFVQAAVYNAVVGIEGRYEPYRFSARAPKASSQAAAAAAAYKILLTYTPNAQHAGLDSAYSQSLAKIPDGNAKTGGVKFGQLAAGALIAQRAMTDAMIRPSTSLNRLRPAYGDRQQQGRHSSPHGWHSSIHCWSKAAHSSAKSGRRPR